MTMNKRAIIAGINENKKDDEFNLLIEETINLCEACNIEVVERCIQKSRKIDPNSAFRKGKLLELKEMVESLNVDCVVFYNNLSISMLARISKICEVEIIDRTNLILDIFSIRAKTREAIIQTQMARLKYDLPKLYLMDMDSERQRGGSDHNRGSGETKIEIARRKIEGQISDLKRELNDLKTQNSERAKKRNNSNLKSVALVGYTNAGKSSLMNYILKLNNKDKFVLQKDMLFATLDTSVRNVSYNNEQFLLFDTVGFVSDLPHELVEAFQSTLNAASEADVLIHVIDSSDTNYENQKSITYSTLKKIGVKDIPIIEVYNKVDKIVTKEHGLRYISCLNGEGINELLVEVINTLYPKKFNEKIVLPYDQMYILDKFKNHYQILDLENKEDGCHIELNCDSTLKNIISKYEKKD